MLGPCGGRAETGNTAPWAHPLRSHPQVALGDVGGEAREEDPVSSRVRATWAQGQAGCLQRTRPRESPLFAWGR